MTSWLPSWDEEEEIFFHPPIFKCIAYIGTSFSRNLVSTSRNFVKRLRHNHKSRLGKILLTKIICAVLMFSMVMPVSANNLKIENVKAASLNTTDDLFTIAFDISWSNSWKDSTNHDAVWLFFKFTTNYGDADGAVWQHMTLDYTEGSKNPYVPTGYSYGSYQSGYYTRKLNFFVPEDRKGCFITAYDSGTGTINFHNVQVRWNYAEDGVTDAQIIDTASTKFKAYGIEMVYVPVGSFYIGDGNGSSESLYAFHKSSANNTAVTVSTTEVTGVTSDSGDPGDLDSTSVTIDGDYGINDGTLDNPHFPTGYFPFYAMKHEISQGMYRDFLNTLDRWQQGQLVESDISADAVSNYLVMCNSTGSYCTRNSLRVPTSGNGTTPPVVFSCNYDGDTVMNESTDGEWVAMNYMKWSDFAAIAAWTALRPMTELEYERIARGTTTKTYGEYAWGSTQIRDAGSSVTNGGMESEWGNSVGAGLCNYNTKQMGPLRVGFAATSSTGSQAYAGSSYLGILELSGNVAEMVVSLGSSTGRAFLGSHGSGQLTTNGYAVNSDWPGYDSSAGEVSGSTGSGTRGGSHQNTSSYMRISDRSMASTAVSARSASTGGRLVRTEDW